MITSNVFYEVRQPGDINLVTEIVKIFEKIGHPNSMNWINDPMMKEAIDAHPKLQRFLINRFWRVQLGLCSESTTRERFSLVDTGTFNEYLSIFEAAVAPSIIKYKLTF